MSVGTRARTCAHWHVIVGGGRIWWRRFCWQSLFVNGSKSEAPYFHTNITIATGRWHHLARCYIQSMPSGSDNSSNGCGWLHRAHCYACPLAHCYMQKEDLVKKILLTIFFVVFIVLRFLLFKNYLSMVLKQKNIYISLWIVTTHYKWSKKYFTTQNIM
jgi:hypothetical protein